MGTPIDDNVIEGLQHEEEDAGVSFILVSDLQTCLIIYFPFHFS